MGVLACSGCYKKIPNNGWLKQKNFLFPHSSEGWKSKIKVLQRSVPSETLFLVFRFHHLSICSHGRQQGLWSLYKVIHPIIKASPSWAHQMFISLLRPCLQIPSLWRFRLQHMDLRGCNSVHRLSWWLSDKESVCQYRRHRFDPWVGKIPWRRKWQPTPVFLPGESHGQRGLSGYSLWSQKEWDTTEWLTLLLSANPEDKNMSILKIKTNRLFSLFTLLQQWQKY